MVGSPNNMGEKIFGQSTAKHPTTIAIARIITPLLNHGSGSSSSSCKDSLASQEVGNIDNKCNCQIVLRLVCCCYVTVIVVKLCLVVLLYYVFLVFCIFIDFHVKPNYSWLEVWFSLVGVVTIFSHCTAWPYVCIHELYSFAAENSYLKQKLICSTVLSCLCDGLLCCACDQYPTAQPQVLPVPVAADIRESLGRF